MRNPLTEVDKVVASQEAQQVQLAKIQADAEIKKAKYAARAESWESRVGFCAILGVVAVILGIAYIIWQAHVGLSDSQQEQIKEVAACSSGGGSWIQGICLGRNLQGVTP